MASVVEIQSTASSAATDTSTTGLLARQPPIGIETAAATNPTHAAYCTRTADEPLKFRIFENPGWRWQPS